MLMKFTCTIILLLAFTLGFSQNQSNSYQNDRKGQLYFYWGWNWGWYSKSNIHFKGPDYDFTLDKVSAKDRQGKFDANIYLNPMNATIPQYNFRVGYFINNNYNVSFGIDHMKYVMAADQLVKISGEISNAGTKYDGFYDNDDIIIEEDFLRFEHTDGLNYVNLEFRRFDKLFAWKKISLNITEGLGAGILYPKTNTLLFNREVHDEFHLSGFGLSAVVGINITFFKYFFIQTEFKGGYINMPDIEISSSNSEKANQDFFFSQLNVVFGASINLQDKKTKADKN